MVDMGSHPTLHPKNLDDSGNLDEIMDDSRKPIDDSKHVLHISPRFAVQPGAGLPHRDAARLKRRSEKWEILHFEWENHGKTIGKM